MYTLTASASRCFVARYLEGPDRRVAAAGRRGASVAERCHGVLAEMTWDLGHQKKWRKNYNCSCRSQTFAKKCCN